MNNLTIAGLQEYIKQKDHHIEWKNLYFMKLIEEVGELSEVIRKDDYRKTASETEIKGTIEEELWDVMYYVLVLANIYEIELEKWIVIKDKLASDKYGHHSDLLSFMVDFHKG